MRRILVSGATSFIGKAFITACLNDDIEIFALVRPESVDKLKDVEDEKLHIIKIDMSQIAYDMDNIVGLYGNLSFDACVSFAWSGVGRAGRMDKDIQSKNIQYTLDLVTLCDKLNCRRFLFSGSQAEYGYTLKEYENNPIKCLMDENFEINPKSEYGKAKFEVYKKAEELCKKYDIEYIHMRIFSVYGSGDHETALVPTCIKKILSKEEPELSECNQMWNYIYIDDCVRAIKELSFCDYNKFLSYSTDNKEVINIAGEDTRILRDFVTDIKNNISDDNHINIKFSRKAEPEEGVPYLFPDIGKLKYVCDFSCEYSFKQGVEKIGKMFGLHK